jgi:hypothetical protein
VKPERDQSRSNLQVEAMWPDATFSAGGEQQDAYAARESRIWLMQDPMQQHAALVAKKDTPGRGHDVAFSA